VRARVRDRLPSTVEPAFHAGNELAYKRFLFLFVGDLLGEALFSPQSIQLSNNVESKQNKFPINNCQILAPIDNVRRVVERDDEKYSPLFCEMM
jgi:hypothetical protein